MSWGDLAWVNNCIAHSCMKIFAFLAILSLAIVHTPKYMSVFALALAPNCKSVLALTLVFVSEPQTRASPSLLLPSFSVTFFLH